MKNGFRISYILTITCLLQFFSQFSLNAFNGDDKELPKVESFDLRVQPSRDNGGSIIFSIRTRDDRNLVDQPKMEINYAFQWKVGSNPPPKCTSASTFRISLSVEEMKNLRIQNNDGVFQTFYAFGNIPKIPILDSTCTEFRDLVKPPAVSLNSPIKSTNTQSTPSVKVFSGKLFLPQLVDQSGRRSQPQEISAKISSASFYAFPWPEKLTQPCLSSQSFQQLQKSSSIITSFESEISRANDLGVETSIVAIESVLELKMKIRQYQEFIDSSNERSWEKIPYCIEEINPNILMPQVKSWTLDQKRKTDETLKLIATLNKEQQVQNANKLASERAGILSLVQSKIKEKNSYVEKLKSEIGRLTASPLKIRSGTSLGATEKSKNLAAQAASAKLEQFKISLEMELDQIYELDVKLESISVDQIEFSDKSSVEFFKNFRRNLEVLRKSTESAIVELLKYTQFYINEIERVKRMG